MGLPEQDVWISTDADVVQTLIRDGVITAQEVTYVKIMSNKTIAVFPATHLMRSNISDNIHEEKHRCGGYVVHNTLPKAKEYIEKLNTATQNQVIRSYTIDNQKVGEELHQKIITNNLQKTITVMTNKWNSRYHNSRNGLLASNWIHNHWKCLTSKRDDISVTPFIHKQEISRQHSLIVTILGGNLKNELVVIGAHLDTISSRDSLNRNVSDRRAPGGDDNASGIAILTELLRLIVKTGYKPEKTIQLMGYAADEEGLLGSKEIAEKYESNGKNVVGMLNLDMSGYRGGPKDIYIINDFTNQAQNTFLSDLMKTYFTEKSTTHGNTSCGYACSSHESWTAQKYPASFIFESDFSNRNKEIHSNSDVKVDAGHMTKFAKLAAVYMAELAKGKTGEVNLTGINSNVLSYYLTNVYEIKLRIYLFTLFGIFNTKIQH